MMLSRIRCQVLTGLSGMLLIAFSAVTCADSQAAPEVVVSIAPIHSLVAAVMKDVGEPHLLVTGNVSPHHFSLKPSGVRKLHRADLVVWIGPVMESFLSKPLQTRGEDKLTLTLTTDARVNLLKNRSGHNHGTNLRTTDFHDRESENTEETEHNALAWDPHLWLDPDNAIAVIESVEKMLMEVDPLRQELYQSNAALAKQQIVELDAKLSKRLSGVRQQPFVVQHDAFQYFEHHFGVESIGALLPAEQLTASAASVSRIIKTIRKNKIACVFREPQLGTGVLDTVAEATGVEIVEIDPLGSRLTAGPLLYLQLLGDIAEATAQCLDG